MNRITRIIEAVEESASGLIRIAYLLAGVTAVSAYFGDGTVPGSVTAIANAALPWVLAAALELHLYLTARRVRAAWQGIQASSKGSEEREKAVGGIRVNLGILAALLAFSCLNQWQYLGQTWTPPTGQFALPLWAAYALRATIVPLAFLAAAFLTPVGESLSARIKTEAHHYAGQVFRVARRQWSAQLRRMQEQDRDVTAALIDLVDDESERRALVTVHKAMFGAQSATGSGDVRSQAAHVEVSSLPEKPPTGPGTPTAQPAKTPRAKREPAIRLVPDRPTRDARTRVRAVLGRSPDVSKVEGARRAKVSPTTFQKYRAEWLAEQPPEPVAV